jgi:DNA (cytosine-5)-methyltransferase 1
MAQHNGGRVGRAIDEPLTTTVHRGTQQQVVAPIIDKYYGNTDAQHLDEPLDTVTAKDRFGLGAAYMEQANTGMVGHDMTSPVSTLVGKGCTQRLVSAALEQIEAVDGRARRQVLEFLWEHFGEPTDAEWEDPIATAAGRLKFGLVVLDGVVWQIVDIGMRMLVPRELYRAQGFSDDYVIEIMFKGKKLTRTAQTRMAGNSVSPPCAAAVLRAFLPPEMQLARMAA